MLLQSPSSSMQWSEVECKSLYGSYSPDRNGLSKQIWPGLTRKQVCRFAFMSSLSELWWCLSLIYSSTYLFASDTVSLA